VVRAQRRGRGLNDVYWYKKDSNNYRSGWNGPTGAENSGVTLGKTLFKRAANLGGVLATRGRAGYKKTAVRKRSQKAHLFRRRDSNTCGWRGYIGDVASKLRAARWKDTSSKDRLMSKERI